MTIDRQSSVCIDSLRVIACGVVVASHVYEMVTGVLDNPINETVSYWAVVLFFFLSGYVNLPSYHRAGSYGRFLVSRARRLFPLYYLALLLSGALAVLYGLARSSDVWNLVFAQSLFVPVIQTNAPLWSLAWEMVLYLAFPVFVQFVQRPSLVSAVALVPLGLVFYLHPALFLAFLVGVFLAHQGIRFPRFDFVPRLGRYTYEVYIFHYPALLVLFSAPAWL